MDEADCAFLAREFRMNGAYLYSVILDSRCWEFVEGFSGKVVGCKSASKSGWLAALPLARGKGYGYFRLEE
ncbi:MAG: hypothetical protein ACOY3Z_12480 [Thermodesulfobacteriota bacterium]